MPIKSPFLGKEIFRLNRGKVEVIHDCPILCYPMDYSPPVSSVHGILQARILEWVAIPFSRGFPQPRDWTWTTALQSNSLPSEPPGKPKWREGKGRTRVKQKLDRCLNCQAPESFWVNSSCAIRLHQSAKIGFKVRSRKAEFYLSFTDKVRQNDVLRKGGWMKIESFSPYKAHHCYI